MVRLLKFLTPPPKWKLPVYVLLGIFFGLGCYVLYLSKAASYLSDSPETCVNCHVMAPQYATWNHSSHREVATCNDCHVPHNNVFNKYFFKAKDGLRHASMFALRMEPEVIFILDEGKEVVHNNCVRCHSQQLTDPKLAAKVPNHAHNTQDRVCWECHREVPHGRVNSLSSVPNARVPLPESPVPDWLKEYMKETELENE
ncbi:cytochrome c nitrite reductase small subunit [Marinifilum breve]|uniref:Cytochrome c-type protein n=1 Tax=Marinifilum breve TaxID=2184082 RepID=A0A2V3ZVD1_9BACT|nr:MULTISPECIES: cytochrome c nitrite reductase small subunit [Marinifilum]MCY1633099.1 cytochrome c nitrite reductase small subunit [Marinifilum sp. D737]PXX99027.1 cytochrome c nitrite reductase small subunit [Marinifilum breve]